MEIKTQISSTFRDIEAEKGTTALCKIVLQSLSDCLDTFQAKDVEDFIEQFKNLALMIKNTKPRMGIVIYYICEIWDKLEDNKSKLDSTNKVKDYLKKVINNLRKEIDLDSDKVIKNGFQHIKDGDVILIHSHSKTVMDIIEKAKNKGKKFKIVVAEQEKEKTLDIIKFLKKKGIIFYVVPEFMLSHIEEEITKVFLGGLTFNDKHYFITDAGTNSVVAEFHNISIPIYIFLTTTKFSLWISSDEHSRNKVKQLKIRKILKECLTYERIKFSHDRISISVIDWLVTEDGDYNNEEAKKLFKSKFDQRKEWHEKHFGQDSIITATSNASCEE
jgi:translation initiation factor 2B subunit (eIF-2B alpha/beta/delta family)